MVFPYLMSGLVLGDIIFDPRRVIFIKSLRALVCADLRESAQIPLILDRLKQAHEFYRAETLIIVGCSLNTRLLQELSQFLNDDLRVLLVSNVVTEQASSEAETMGFEVHRELVWGKYRFVENLEVGAVELYFVSAIGGSGEENFSYCVRVGKSGLGGMHLPVFLKGLGQLMLPSVNVEAHKASVFRKSLGRYDVFAVGHHRVFPLGKVADLKEVRTLGQIPLAPSTLGNKHSKVTKRGT